MTNSVSVPLELLQDLRDLASDTVEHHRPFASYKSGRQERMDKVIRSADRLLAAAPQAEPPPHGLIASVGGGSKACGHDFECGCALDKARRLLESE